MFLTLETPALLYTAIALLYMKNIDMTQWPHKDIVSVEFAESFPGGKATKLAGPMSRMLRWTPGVRSRGSRISTVIRPSERSLEDSRSDPYWPT